MSNLDQAHDFFRVGGTLGPDVPSYVVRTADEELPRLVLAGHFCYVLTARQMGKSSLMVRTARRLQTAGVRVAMVELGEIGTEDNAEAWYLSLISQIHGRLKLSADYQAWWNAHAGLSPVQRFSDYLRRVVLEEISGKVAIFIDEIDTTLKLPFSDDFFAAIRAVYNARASDPEYERLTFVLLGVAMPADLIEDRTRTPFNIGQGVALQEFSLEEGEVLQDGLEAAYPEARQAIFTRIYHWTGGHPYLTQKLCAAAVEFGDGPWEEEQVDALVEESFFTEEASRKESNLTFVQDRVQASPDARKLLRLYRRVRGGKEVPDEERSALESRLKLYGLVRATPQGTLAVRNRIYERVFDLEWVKETMPSDVTRWVVVASVLVAVIALAVAGYFYIRAQRQTAEFYTEQFRTSTSPDVRVTSLAGLLGLSGYEEDAQRLFFEELAPDEQVAMFGVSNPEELREELIAVVKSLYTKLDNTPQNNAILQAMSEPLQELDEVKARNLAIEIEQWLQGREFYDRGQYQEAIDAYDVAVSLSDSNPATHLDRGLAHASLGDYVNALTDFARVIEFDSTWQEQVKTIVNQDPALYTYWGLHRNDFPAMADLFPTLTPTRTQTATPTGTLPPTPTAIRFPTATRSLTPTYAPTPPGPPVPGPTPTDLEANSVWEWSDRSTMVYVPAGTFWMGGNDNDPDAEWREKPQHQVYLDAFWLDRTEVTNTQYQVCVETGECREPSGEGCEWGEPTYGDATKVNHPVECVSWNDANTYCAWAGKRLPTEAEWEKAARGTDRRIYPWGSTFDGRRLNFCDRKCSEDWSNPSWDDDHDGTAPVGSYQDGVSPYGALDMAGNVREWVADWYDGLYYYNSPDSNPQGPASGEWRIVRGGSLYDPQGKVRITYRVNYVPSVTGNIVGFRCAYSDPNSLRLTETPASTQTPMPVPTAGGLLAVGAECDGNLEIFVVGVDGSGWDNLTNSAGYDVGTYWSPDGERFAFESMRDGNREIYVMNADGSGLRNLTNNPANDEYPTWSPDSKRIAFASNRNESAEIYVVNVDGSELTNLTNSPAYDDYPVWSPDGEHIAFISWYDENPEILVMNADGSGITRLTDSPAWDGFPIWSQDGKRITFRSDRAGNWEIYVMNADGSGLRNLTNNLANDYCYRSSWSPSGDRIAFMSSRDGNTEIYLVNSDGGGLTNLTNTAAGDGPFRFTWSPDGNYIAFLSGHLGDYGIYSIATSDSETARLIHREARCRPFTLSWSPK